MQSVAEYFARTESAMKVLFNGVNSYLNILSQASGAVFVTDEPSGTKRDAEFLAWQAMNVKRIATAMAAEREFLAESFALDTLCGAILQVADKALEIYGSNIEIPLGLPASVKQNHSKFCVGRSIRSIPLGLIIHAARNQHSHFDDGKLREPNSTVFSLLATAHGYSGERKVIDPAFDIANQRVLSFASNVIALIGWHSYNNYMLDMHAMLRTKAL